MASGRERAETLTSVHSTLRESFLASDLADNHEIPRSLAGLTLAAVLNNERKSTSNSTVVRTLLDIIRTEETLANNPTRQHFTGRKTWKSFKERLKLRRNSSNPTGSHHDHSGWMSATPVPQSDVMVNRNSLQDTLRNSSIRRANSFSAEAGPPDDTRENGDQRSSSMRLAAALAAEREQARVRLSTELERRDEEGGGDANAEDQGLPSVSGEPAQEEPTRMSLMDLLEETDRQAGVQGITYRFDDEDEGEGERKDEEEEREDEEIGGGGVGEKSCCVCMVRHKGAAFIPCGHTFCRMCSRELWVQRGHCPLCNNFILEILDIF